MNDIDDGYEVEIDPSNEMIKKFPKTVAVIPILNSPIFPGMIAPIILSEDKYTAQLDQFLKQSGHVALNLIKFKDCSKEKKSSRSKQPAREKKGKERKNHNRKSNSRDIYKVGILCKVVKKLKLQDGSVNLLVHGMKRYRARDIIQENPFLITRVEVFNDILEAKDDSPEEMDAYTRSVINQVKRLSEINPYFNEEMKLAMINSPSPGALADLVAFALSLDIPEAQDFIETLAVKKRFAKLLVYLKREKDVAEIQKKINDEVNDKVNKYQREYFLREQLKVIRGELGMEEDDKARDLKKIRTGIKKAGLPPEAMKTADEELERLETIAESSPEYNIVRTYLYWLIDLPWKKSTEDSVEISAASKILEKDHYGLEKPKERILEFLAVRKLRPKFEGTILCLVGPPGVGKTSLGKSMAQALGREFYRFSLGGMRDEAEIKGHRRTYVGAMPGKMIQALKRVRVNNPVIMLDEVDKMGASFQGDPASALLEVLDPEQNSKFIDNYLDIPFDLSNVLFVATANTAPGIPAPLLDRMEVIELSGYSLEEKLSIAVKWVIPKQLKKHGLLAKNFSLSKGVLKKMISDYAREPGVRTMEQYIAKLCRKAALIKVGNKRARKFAPKEKDLEKILGSTRFQSETSQKSLAPGIVVGLAWTQYGGEILYVETIPLEGKGFKLTGQMGNVMNESATLAYSYVKKLIQSEMSPNKKITLRRKSKVQVEENMGPQDYFSQHEVHLHLPAGATPKDGPSAGVTMATALYGLATNKKVRSGIAMTGELSLTGRVLPIGGLKEKVLAAKRAGIKDIIFPFQNKNDLKEVPERHRNGLNFHPVKNFNEILDIAFK